MADSIAVALANYSATSGVSPHAWLRRPAAPANLDPAGKAVECSWTKKGC